MPSKTTLLKISIISCGLAWAVLYSLAISVNIPTFHLDGAFQTASGLYRLDTGQFPGKDFFPYLGIGPLLVLYPFFKALGANISASLFSAQLAVLVLGLFSVALVWQLIWRPVSFLSSLLAGCILLVLPIGVATVFTYSPGWNFSLFNLPLPGWIMETVSPGYSLRPLRAAAPYLVVLVYYFFVMPIRSPQKKYILSGVLTGASLLWSNDFAIPAAGLFVPFVLLSAYCSNEFQKMNVVLYLVSSLLSWGMLLTVVTLGHPLNILHYNFMDVPPDQWWYFVPYSESSRIFSIHQLDRLFFQKNVLSLIVLAWTALIAFRTRCIEHALLVYVGVVLCAGGAVASVGGHLWWGYFFSFHFWALATVVIGFFNLVWMGFEKTNFFKPPLTTGLALIVLGTSLFLTINFMTSLRSEVASAKNDPSRFFVPELGGYLDTQWINYIDLARKAPETGVFEEYWGLWSATRRSFSTWPVDSTIHALGSIRARAAQELKNAKVVITTRYAMSPAWQPWCLSQNYWLYEGLLRNWTPFAESPTTIVWHKDEHARQFEDVPCNFDNNGTPSLIVQATAPGFYEIDMNYSSSGKGRLLTMVRNNISLPLDTDGYVSIDPKATSVRFPAYFDKAGAGTLDTKIIGNSQARLNISSCAARYISEADNAALQKPAPFRE